MKVEYIENGDLAIFNGMKFRRDKKTGYFLNSTTRTRLHRAVWAYYNGIIPAGFQIHHIDENKNNNEISNLHIMKKLDHLSLHGKERAATHYDELIENLTKNAIPKASEWHRSEEGRKWHSKHGKEVVENLPLKEIHCIQCQKTFYKKTFGQNKFCRNACKSAYRRKSGVDNEIRECLCCGKTYETNKYSKQSFCSRKCSEMFRKSKSDTTCGKTGCLQHGSRETS